LGNKPGRWKKASPGLEMIWFKRINRLRSSASFCLPREILRSRNPSGYFTGACPAVPRSIPKDSAGYLTGVAPVDGTGVEIKPLLFPIIDKCRDIG